MAISTGPRPDYDLGKVTLTAGLDVFTTVGGSLDIIAVQAGDTILTPSGLFLVIAEITGAESGKLVFPCPAQAAGVDLPLRIRFQPEGSRLMATAAAILSRFSSGNVTSLADLESQANTMPFFSGIGQMELAALTAYARTLLDDPDQAAALATLTNGSRLGTIATGAADLNTIAENGFYGADSTTLNRPGDGGNWLVFHMARTSTIHTQFALSRATADIQYRYNNGTEWKPWERVVTQSIADATYLSFIAAQSLTSGQRLQAAANLGFAQSLSANGYQKLPSGLICQIGSQVVTLAATNAGVVTLPTAYPANHVTTILMNGDWGVTEQRTANFVLVGPQTGPRSTISFACSNGAASSAIRVQFISYGY
ncbi:hypothetical protein C5748_03790 [Phyllobacterium phragmitis]|uniref:Putative tail fiber protein gp53-like C-terminal domain-containing protein n=1 Tax=Phyllobacterium phragmitis TaxID=2670329 RepID=A0A2S9IXT0_9HYPH|nr:pyocin knob domain-containing protein [Phyllobacterium phragmitis]PRD45327.1 hypothetical protein C5748_03790 [Phyllobacterium phragmitis]